MPARTAIVTGAYGGLGSELCKLLAARGIDLILVDRNLEKSRAFAASLNIVRAGTVLDAFAVDLADHVDIARLTSAIRATYPVIDLLFNNAGVLTEAMEVSGHGNELHFEVNTLAPLQMIDGLRPSLARARGATIVNTSAGISLGAKQLDWADLIKPVVFKKLYGPYVNSKQALNVLTAALAPELQADGISIRAADPGPNKTRLTSGRGTPLWMRLFYAALPSPDKGARKICDAALATGWQERTGIFISGGKVRSLSPALEDASFRTEFLRKCRERAALPVAT